MQLYLKPGNNNNQQNNGLCMYQTRPDVHKIVLSVKLRPPPPPPPKSVKFEDFLPICAVLPHFGPFSKFCRRGFDGHPDFCECNVFVDDGARYDRERVRSSSEMPPVLLGIP